MVKILKYNNHSLKYLYSTVDVNALSNMTVTVSGVSRIQLQADLPVQAVHTLDKDTIVVVDLLNRTESEIR